MPASRSPFRISHFVFRISLVCYPMPSHPTYRPGDRVIATDLGSEIVLLDAGSQESYSLNASGREAWLALVGDGVTVEGAAARIAERFDATPERALGDLRALVAELVGAGLLLPPTAAEHGDGGR